MPGMPEPANLVPADLPLAELGRPGAGAERVRPLVRLCLPAPHAGRALFPYSDYALESLAATLEGRPSQALIEQPLAHFLTRRVLEGRQSERLLAAGETVVERVRPRTAYLYRARCPLCRSEAELVALLYRDGRPEAARLSCPAHGDVEPFASCDERQTLLFQRLSGLWMRIADQENLWTPPLYRRHAERGASLPPPHSPRALLALAALLRAINESPEGRLRDLFFLAFTSMFLELYPPTAGVAEPPLRVEYNVVQSFGRHVRRLARRLHRLAPHWSQHAGRAQLVLRRQPGLDLSDWPDRHGALVYLDLSHLTRVSPLALPSLWADGFRADPAGQDSDVRFFPRRPPFTPDLERLGPDPLEVVCAELSRVTEHGGHLFLSCGGVTEQGMVRVLAALQRAGLDVKGPFDLSEWMPHWRNRSPRPRPPALLYARKPPARSRARAG